MKRNQNLIHQSAGVLAMVGIFLLGTAHLSSAQDSETPAAEETPKVEEKPKPKWQRSMAAGITLTKGNSDTLLFTANAVGIRKWDKNELELGADGARGENNGTVNTETLSGYFQYNRLVSEKAYFMLRTEALHDTIADVELRLTVSPGVGYYLIKEEKRNLGIEVGPTFVYDKLGSGDNSYMALRVGERFETAISERARLWQTMEWLPQVNDMANFIVNFELGVEADLTEKLSLRVTLQDVYDNEPAPGRQENDIRLVSGIAYKF